MIYAIKSLSVAEIVDYVYRSIVFHIGMFVNQIGYEPKDFNNNDENVKICRLRNAFYHLLLHFKLAITLTARLCNENKRRRMEE